MLANSSTFGHMQFGNMDIIPQNYYKGGEIPTVDKTRKTRSLL